MRAHLYKAITNNAGDLQSSVTVRILQPDSPPDEAEVIIDPVFTTKTGEIEAGTTLIILDGVVDVWLDDPQYVMLGMAPEGEVEYFIDNVAVLAPFPVTIIGTPEAGQVLVADGPDSATWTTL